MSRLYQPADAFGGALRVIAAELERLRRDRRRDEERGDRVPLRQPFLVERGRQRCRRFTWERTAAATLDSYRRAVAR